MELEKVILLIVLILIFAIFILFISLWGWSLKKDISSTPVVRNNQPSKENANPSNLTLFSGQLDTKQPSSGYNSNALQAPCVNKNVNSGIANLPSSYVLQDCGFGKECSDDIFKGSVCLSKIGFPCLTKTDCVPEANDCLSNICVSDNNKLNNICISDSDCDTTNNFSCVKDKNSTISRCKLNNYPLSSGCNSNTDCAQNDEFNDVICFGNFKNLENYDLLGTYNNGSITMENEDLVDPFINKLLTNETVCLIIDNTNNIEYFYKMRNYISPLTFTPEPFPSSEYENEIIFVNQNKYTVRMLSSLNKGGNFCISTIPLGGKLESVKNDNIKNLLDELPNPCAFDGKRVNKKSGSYCLSDTMDLSKTGSFCDTSSSGIYPDYLSCNQEDSNNYKYGGVSYKLHCLYDQVLDNSLKNNYNYINSKEPEIMGRCLYPVSKKGENCNKNLLGCSVPNICISDDNSNSVCLENLNVNVCGFNGYCPDGFSCSDNNCIPETSNICISSDCNNLIYLYSYSSKYEKKYSLGVTGNIEDFDLILGKNKIEDNVSKIIIYDKDKNDLSLLSYENNNYKLDKKIHLTFQNVNYHSILLDKDDKILLVYSKITTNFRKRKYKIAGINNISPDEQKIRLDTNFSNLVNGMSVYFEGNEEILVNSNKVYTIVNYNGNGNGSDFQLKFDQETIVNYGNLTGFIITYDNRISYNTLNYDSDYLPYGLSYTAGIGLCDEDENTKYSWINNGDCIKFNNNIEVECPTVGISNTATMGGNSAYFLTESSIYDTYSYYLYSDNYNSSEGSVPFIDGKKFISQNLKPEADTIGSLQPDTKVYGLYYITDDVTNGSIAGISSPSTYVSNGTSIIPNGILDGITYGFQDGIEVKLINDEDTIIINSKIKYLVNENDSKVYKFLNMGQRLTYSIGGYDSGVSRNFLLNNGEWFNFDYTNSSLAPASRNLYTRENESGDIDTNFPQNIYNNSFSIQENEDFNFINTYINNDIDIEKNDNITVASKSQMKKMVAEYTENDNMAEKLTFKNLENIFKTGFYDLQGGLVQINKQDNKNTKNTFIEGQTLITFNNQKDIDLILKYSTSEIGIVKTIPHDNSIGTSAFTDHGLSNIYRFDSDVPFWTTNFRYGGPDPGGGDDSKITTNVVIGSSNDIGVILVITDIIEHNVELNSEYLICKINRPINYKVELSGDYQLESYIIDYEKTNWKVYPYNFVPIAQRTFNWETNDPFPDDIGNFNLMNVFDSSILYTSGKHNDFFKNKDYTRTSYNKIISATSVGTPNEGTKYNYTMYNIADGYGAKYDNLDVNSDTLPFVRDINLSENQNVYDVNHIVTNAEKFAYNTFVSHIYPGTQDSFLNLFIVFNDTSYVITPSEGISYIGLPYNVPLPLNFENYAPDGGTSITAIYPLPRKYNNFTFTFYPCGRLSKMILLGCRFFSDYTIDHREIGNTIVANPGYAAYYGESFDTGFTSSETDNLRSYIEDFFEPKVNRSESISVRDLYDYFNSSMPVGNRNIKIEDLLIGPEYNNIISMSAINNTFPHNADGYEPGSAINAPINYAVNNMFLTTLNSIRNLSTGKVSFNNHRIVENFIISNKSNNDDYKNKGALPLGVDSFSLIVENKTNSKILTNLDQSSLSMIKFPQLDEKYKILNIFYYPYNDNTIYYAYTEYKNLLNDVNYQMFFFNADGDLINDKGVAIPDPSDNIYLKNNFQFSTANNNLMLLAYDKK